MFLSNLLCPDVVDVKIRLPSLVRRLTLRESPRGWLLTGVIDLELSNTVTDPYRNE